MATSIPTFSKLQNLGSQVLQRFQQNVDATLTPAQSAITELQGSPTAQAILASFKSLGNVAPYTDFVLTHNLGRTPVAIVAALSNVYGSIVISQTPNPKQSTQAILRCSLEIPGKATLSFLVM